MKFDIEATFNNGSLYFHMPHNSPEAVALCQFFDNLKENGICQFLGDTTDESGNEKVGVKVLEAKTQSGTLG